MHDLAAFRSDLDAAAARLASRGFTLDVDEFRQIDAERRAALTEAERLKAERNTASQEIARAKKAGEDTAERQATVRGIGERISQLDDRAKELDDAFRTRLLGIPIFPHESVPQGRSSEENVEVRRVGQPRSFDFPAQAHWDLGPALGILDLERAAKITGARFAVYAGIGARLERALVTFLKALSDR